MITKEDAYKQSKVLVDRFSEQIDSYKRSEYNETETRRDFIDPLFGALNWDIDNSQGYAETFREVVHEDKIKIGHSVKAPDYSFRLGGKRIFFVEAKKPSVVIKDNNSVAYQVRRYGWSARLPISIITDFEEFAVYDCSQKPYPSDNACVARIKYLTFDKYLNEFDYLWNTFSKECILRGSLDRYVRSDSYKKSSAPVDKDFLISLNKWREALARNISNRNKGLNEDEINFAIQQTIDRLIFLRIMEDKGIEPVGQLKVLVNQSGNVYQNLFSNFEKANDKYNSGIFDFKKDIISKSLNIDNIVIKKIVEESNPYEFSMIPVEILGCVYEQFLGKQIKISPSHRVHIEDKHEIRKAGGVYYTPQNIVDYIVENTVGTLIEGKTPEQIQKIKIIDPACGSGSFLTNAYAHLMNYHIAYYHSAGIKAGKKDSPVTPDGKLTLTEKKRILTNSIYGVDIDANAVEVTKFSLLLKCLDDENATTILQYCQLRNDRILPNLDNNIKWGNSLIGSDFYDEKLDFDEEKKIKPLEWETVFPEIFRHDSQDGFDAVISNPPYVVIEGEYRNNDMLSYFKEKFSSASYKIDLYHLFIEKGLKILKSGGLLGYITPSNYFSNNGLIKLRKTILENSHIILLNNINGKVFAKVSVDTAITILSKSNNTAKSRYIQSNWKDNNLAPIQISEFDQSNIIKSKELIFTSTAEKIKLSIRHFDLGEKYAVKFGIQLRDRKIFTTDVISKDQTELISKYHRPCYTGKDINKWTVTYNNLLAYFNPEAKMGGCWNEIFHNSAPKIIVRQIGATPICGLDLKGYCCLNTVFMIVPKIQNGMDIKCVLGLLNSSFIAYFWKQNFSDQRQTFPKIKGSYLEKLPIPLIDLKSQKEKELHDEIVHNIDLIIDINERLGNTKLHDVRDQYNVQIKRIEKLINFLVYELYGLTKKEIDLIESIVKPTSEKQIDVEVKSKSYSLK